MLDVMRTGFPGQPVLMIEIHGKMGPIPVGSSIKKPVKVKQFLPHRRVNLRVCA